MTTTARKFVTRVLPYLLLVWAGIAVSLLVEPAVRRAGGLSELAYWISYTGKELLVLVIVTAIVTIVTRPGARQPRFRVSSEPVGSSQ